MERELQERLFHSAPPRFDEAREVARRRSWALQETLVAWALWPAAGHASVLRSALARMHPESRAALVQLAVRQRTSPEALLASTMPPVSAEELQELRAG